MRHFAGILAFTCAACSIVTDLGNLRDSGADVEVVQDSGIDVMANDAEAGTAYVFTDDFDRADDAAVGKGWIVKNPAFEISSNRALRDNQSTTLDYHDLVVYRPAAEAYLDEQASMEVTLLSLDGSAANGIWPQLHVRIQANTVALPGALDDYALFPQNGMLGAMTIARDRLQANFVALATFPLSTPMMANATYRFTLQATGTSPVELRGSVERYDAPSWTMLGQITTQDIDTTNAIVSPGVVGFSASKFDATGAYAYDNFTATGN